MWHKSTNWNNINWDKSIRWQRPDNAEIERMKQGVYRQMIDYEGEPPPDRERIEALLGLLADLNQMQQPAPIEYGYA
jgi:hypothetical protein